MGTQAVALAASIIIILAGAYRRVPDAYTLGLSAVIVGFSIGMPAGAIAVAAGRAALSVESLEFVGCVAVIRLMSGVLQEYGFLDRMSSSLNRVLRNCKLAIMAVPALLGGLSVFGGAIMSAPVVDRMGDRLALTPQRKAAVNIMFRHSVFFAFPFSTMLIFAANVAGLSTLEMAGVLWPLTIVMTASSYLLLLRKAVDAPEPADVPYRESLGEFVLTSSPIWVALLLAAFLHMRLVAALASGLAIALLLARMQPGFTPRVLRKFVDFQAVGAVLGVMVFKDFISKMGLLESIMVTLTRAGIPAEVVGSVGMLIFCYSSGTTQAGSAVVLPLLLAGTPDHNLRLLRACLIYTVGFVSYLVSPVHMCQVLTNRYFRINLTTLYREYWPVPVVTLCAGIALYLVHATLG